MRDFGFWVRMVAISQLFGVVLSNYGGHWLSPDNPLVTMGDKPAAVQHAEKANPVTSGEKGADESADDSVELRAERWGGAEDLAPEPEEDADWAAGGGDGAEEEADADPEFNEGSEAVENLDESQWGGGAAE